MRTTASVRRRIAASLLLLAVSTPALALKPVRITPQGEVSRVRQFVVQFDTEAVVAGQPGAPAPYKITCESGNASVKIPAHHAAWRNAKTWAADFDDDLPPDVRCTAKAVAGFKSPKGEALAPDTVQFRTGAPVIRYFMPSGQIDEAQIFILNFNGDVNAASVQAASRCQVEGIGEAIPTVLVEGKERTDILSTRWFAKTAEQQPKRYVLLRCNRTLPSSAAVTLHVGEYRSAGGLVNKTPKKYNFHVRPPFEVEFSCERPNAQAACLPIRPLTLNFSSPIPVEQAKKIVLKTGKEDLSPSLSSDEAKGSDISTVSFKALFPEQASMQIVLPADLRDDAGRTLRNADSFPLTIKTGPMPPLAKFASTDFGIIERFAEGKNGPALLPISLRNVEAGDAIQASGNTKLEANLRTLTLTSDADIIRWYRKIQRYQNQSIVSRKQAAKDDASNLPPPIPKPAKGSPEEELPRIDDNDVETRAISLLSKIPGVQTQAIPVDGKAAATSPRPFEVIGIPMQPGFHVLEVASSLLGESLLDTRYGKHPMYVRTSALVTNLGVHFKGGRENALVWVTRLDDGKPVANAQVAISGCDGKPLVNGQTNEQGIWQSPTAINASECNSEETGYSNAFFVSARATDAKGVQDMAFVWSDWDRGIEPWRFNAPTSERGAFDLRAHSVLDRSLFRAGETVSMKHYLRAENLQGLTSASATLNVLRIMHTGSGEQVELPLQWQANAGGGQSAVSEWQIPKNAKLGEYTITLNGKDQNNEEVWLESGSFRVEEFRLPTMTGSIVPVDKPPFAALNKLPIRVQLAYINGGAANGLPVHVSASSSPGGVNFTGHDEFSFGKTRRWRYEADEEADENADDSGGTRLLADHLALKLDKNGSGELTIENIPASDAPVDITLEASYSDPNGEIQSLQSRQRIWPAAVVAGIKTEGWVSVNKDLKLQALALNTDGTPKANTKLNVRAIAHKTVTSRKRLVGGFYSYDNQQSVKDLGSVCSGTSDSRGLLLCNVKIAEAGEIELIATASDDKGKTSEASTSVTVTRQGEIWWGGDDHDRMDVLPEKRTYQPGETAKFQVRMPFRRARALLTVEREGILHSEIITLTGQDPTVELKIRPEWGPNVYVSVLALRGRLYEVPWYSFFTWGFKSPREWWQAFRYDSKEYAAPTALVDLSKPAFRLGMAEIEVGLADRTLKVDVKADKESYQVREQAQVTIDVHLPDGKPAANAEVAVAAVDQALLELLPNRSWDLLHAMYQQRAWGVYTATAQMEIVGRRHYGRKAVAAGGGGGTGLTRELLDTLLLWNPRVKLDANGQAKLSVPLNDALTRFKIVAIADSGLDRFGTGETSIRSTQDLQIISGLPPLVREGDQFRAQITLRNTTQKEMKVDVAPRATLLELKPQTVTLPANGAQEIAWDVTAPVQLAFTRTQEILWEISAKDTAGSRASDALKISQRIIPATPVTVQQALLAQVDGQQIDFAPPPDSLNDPTGKVARGGLKVTLQPSLAESLPSVRDWFANYPFICLEQKASKAIGLRDKTLWQKILNDLPTYIDADGLASYFPPQTDGPARGSDTLTAYLLAVSHEAGKIDPDWQLPAAQRDRMLAGLTRFVEGKIERKFWSPRADRDPRKLAALEALSRYGRLQTRMLTSLTIAPNEWPTHALIDWVSILQRTPSIPERNARYEEAMQILRSRLSYQGTQLVFSTERDDYWWWLMVNSDVNGARLMLAVLDDPAWKDDLPALAVGLLARQKYGTWATTNANLWGGLAIERFAAKTETAPVAGQTRISLGGKQETIDWNKVTRAPETSDTLGKMAAAQAGYGAPPGTQSYINNSALLPWTIAGGGKPATLTMQQQGSGKPWATVQALAAVPLKAPLSAGYTIKKTVTPTQEAVKGKVTCGDVWRVRLEVNAAADMTWVVLSDPVPGGATLLGSGLGRDSALATGDEQSGGRGWLAFVERSFEAYRAYYEHLPKGKTVIEYTVRLNNAGHFNLPPTRAEALYAPEVFGATPNAPVRVEQANP